MYDFLIAIALITGTSDVTPSENMLPVLRNAAIAMELLDKREQSWFFTHPTDNDLDVIRSRWVELRDAPPLHHCMRFPAKWLCSDYMALNRDFHYHLEDRQWSWRLQIVKDKNDRLYEIWDAAHDTRAEYYYIAVRRAALKKLRDRLSEEDYYYGRLPPPVPIEHFMRIGR